eukprot:CAMPEP_0172596602 /NCGR_PEP_ID=MMETSP1068-20121228/16447_1 /TAXON_ID=35684 /ORGANISM="Pseudopedinella elastica, Strain CCMP716" /LENGTH=144 /DNA_ID=CAMNT_0013395733 /DNA_START=125 /DNA_END=555 /DNA_ORIENTATION=-
MGSLMGGLSVLAIPLCASKVPEESLSHLPQFSSLTVAQLKDELRARGLKVGGVKAELIQRLSEVGSPGDTGSSPPPKTKKPGSSETGGLEAAEGAELTDDGGSLPPAALEAIVTRLSGKLKLERWRVAGAVKLFEEENTLPFIA